MPPSVLENILSQANRLSSDERKALADALATSASEGSRSASPRRSAYGKYAGKLTTVDEFLRMKHEETDHEDKRLSE
jgi:hypothetical protein